MTAIQEGRAVQEKTDRNKEEPRRSTVKEKQATFKKRSQSECTWRSHQIVQMQLPDTSDSESIVTCNSDPEDCFRTLCNIDDDGKWVQCDKCNTWFHYSCVNLQTDACMDGVEWFCTNC